MKKHTLGEWMIAVRPWSIPASAMPIIVTLAYLFYKGSEINWLYGIWALIGMILFQPRLSKEIVILIQNLIIDSAVFCIFDVIGFVQPIIHQE